MERRSLPPHETRRLEALVSGLPDAASRLEQLVRRRLGGEPLQYLEGTAAFGPLELMVDERVLIPRPETEQLLELAVGLVGRPRVVVDLCTGSGAVALGLAARFPSTQVLASDVSPAAAEVARTNAERLGLRVEVRVGDLFEALPESLRGEVDLLVANPPYVAETEWPDLPEDVRREPRVALVAGPAGTEVLDRIAAEASSWLAPGGWVACEIGERQGDHVRAAFSAELVDVQVRRDLAGRERFVLARRR